MNIFRLTVCRMIIGHVKDLTRNDKLSSPFQLTVWFSDLLTAFVSLV